MFLDITAIPVHLSAGGANGNTIIAEVKIILVFPGLATLAVEINERDNGLLLEIPVKGIGIVSRIQKDLGDRCLRQEIQHSEPCVAKAMGIVP